MTPLDKPLRRALEIGERSYTLLVDASGLKLTEKGKRKGIELKWTELVGGGEVTSAQQPIQLPCRVV
jgi:hypothetical protein